MDAEAHGIVEEIIVGRDGGEDFADEGFFLRGGDGLEAEVGGGFGGGVGRER